MNAQAPARDRGQTAGRGNWLTVIVIALLVVGYLSLRARPTDVGSAEAFVASLSAGQPTVITFYNNA